MQIQNKALANVTLRCRSGENVTGDALGVFEMSEDDADVILGTAGWEVYRAPPPVKPLRVRIQEATEDELRKAKLEDERLRDEAAAAELEAERIEQERIEQGRTAAALAQTQKPSSPPMGLPAMPPPPPTLESNVPVSDAEADDLEETEEIDLDVLNKEQLLELAEKYKVTVDKRWGETRLREELAKAIFVPEGE